jgi:hypothetical protein
MANYPQTGSLLQNRINSGLSTQITIKVNNTTVGAVQRLSITQNRDLWRHEEIGTDGVVEIHPKGAAKIDLTVERIVFDGMRLPEAFARGFINLQAQRVPFDIHIIDNAEVRYTGDAIVHVFNNCWFRQYNPQFHADSFIVSESAQIWCEYVTTTRNGVSAVIGGLRGIGYEHDTMERASDTKGFRGRYEKSNFGDPLESI